MSLCEVCSNIDLRTLLLAAHERHKEGTIYGNLETISEDTVFQNHHKSMNELEIAAGQCDFCTLLWSEATKKERFFNKKRWFDGDEGVFLYVLHWGFSQDESSRRMMYLGVRIGEHIGLYPHQSYALFQSLKKDDPAASLVPKMLSQNTGSLECLEKAKQWLTACEADHTECHRASGDEAKLPTRVLKVGIYGDCPAVYESQGETGRWMALSYCWGGSHDFVLNRITYASMIEGRPLIEFPETIRDAIIITRYLGIKYLWVDALCILQDSKSDWDREAPSMSRIYSYAVLTIINPDGPSVTSGIFRDREGFGNGGSIGPSCRLPWKRNTDAVKEADDATGLRLESILIRGGEVSIHDWAAPNSVWSSRGWTLQEELLSWRTLAFNKEELLWSCPSTQLWENGQLRVATVDRLQVRRPGVLSVQRARPNLGQVKWLQNERPTSVQSPAVTGLRTLSTKEIYPAWYATVENFSKRKLTRDTDQLMAIAGLAKDVGEYITDNYCAGLWQNDLIAGLAWQYEYESNYTPNKLTTNSNLNLPSWSWASINNEVNFRFKEESAMKRTKQYTEVAQVNELKIFYMNGNFEGCELRLNAPSYSWSVNHEGGTGPRPAFHDLLWRELTFCSEYQARHKAYARQTIVAQQLAWIDDDLYAREMVCALLISETIEPPMSSDGEQRYRRVSLLFYGKVETIREPAWPMETIWIV